MIKCLAH